MFDITSARPSFDKVQKFTQLHTDYMYSYSSHPNCILTAITKNLCKNQAHVDKEVCNAASACFVCCVQCQRSGIELQHRAQSQYNLMLCDRMNLTIGLCANVRSLYLPLPSLPSPSLHPLALSLSLARSLSLSPSPSLSLCSSHGAKSFRSRIFRRARAHQRHLWCSLGRLTARRGPVNGADGAASVD